MATIQELQQKYKALNELDEKLEMASEARINPDCLLAFDYEYPGQDSEVVIDTDEFTAVCPWTGLPDFGTLVIRYVPDRLCIELKSLKYYLLSYTGVGIVQEHAANRILNDLVASCEPLRIEITLDYKVRGGLHTVVTARYEKEQ
jgi:7-cyano-7-deazaguanine reductase